MKTKRCTRGIPTRKPQGKRAAAAYAWRCVIREGVKLKRGDTVWRCRVAR